LSPSSVGRRRVAVFLVTAFAVSWTAALGVHLTGGLAGSPRLAGLPVTLAAILVVTGYMWGPAAGNAVARLATGEGRARSGLGLRRAGRPRYWIVAWFGPAALTVLGAALYFALAPARLDPGLTAFGRALAAAGAPEADPRLVLGVQVAVAVGLGPLLNLPAVLGEELGWRGYLLPKLLGLGERRAALLVGVVWGVWHWPLVAMGHNYGLSYPGAPWLGPVAMTLFTVEVGVALAWLTLRTGSVWPAALAHGGLNAVAAVGLVLADGAPATLVGPAPTGVVGGLPWLVVALALLGGGGLALRPGATETLPVPGAATADGPTGPDPIAGSEGVVEGRTRDGGGR
jgi:membrane protease YdiL (CAAX protease family)